MRFALPTIALSLAIAAVTPAIAASVPVARQLCAEASRFGNVEVVPSTLSVGDEFTVHTDFTCALTFDIVPKYIDYYVEILSGGNGHGGPILLARREFHQSATLPPTDTFTTTLPDAFYQAAATYGVVLDTTYAINGTNGTPFFTQGGVENPITITGITSS